jgi:hypothetical protein
VVLLVDRGEVRLYFDHVLALIVPGHRPKVPDNYGVEPGVLEEWSDSDLDLMLNEGRRELDASTALLNDLRSRGQVLFTILLAFVGFAVGGRVLTTVRGSTPFFAFWYLGLVLTGIGLLGAAAVFATTAEMGSVDAELLSREPPTGLKRGLAAAYPQAVKRSKLTTMARFTVLRDATWFGVLGVLTVLGAWIGLKLTS